MRNLCLVLFCATLTMSKGSLHAKPIDCSSGPMDQLKYTIYIFSFTHTSEGPMNFNLRQAILHSHEEAEELPFTDIKISTKDDMIEFKIDQATEIRISPSGSGLFQGSIETSTTQETISVSCWPRDIEPQFRYDSKKGYCVDSDQHPGMNSWPIEQVRALRLGECVDLRGVDLGEGDYRYPTLVWNLKGAHLEGANLFFGDLIHSSFEGARMKGLDFGYANISGSFDQHTELPSDGCRTSESRLTCSM